MIHERTNGRKMKTRNIKKKREKRQINKRNRRNRKEIKNKHQFKIEQETAGFEPSLLESKYIVLTIKK